MHNHDFDWNESYSGDASDREEPDGAVLKIAEELSCGRALDLGCGAGGLAIALAHRGWRVHGIDITAKAIGAAQKAAAQHEVEVDLNVDDATTFESPTQFDLITCCFALPVDRAQREQVYARTRAALAPGGHVLFKDFDATMARHERLARYDMPTLEELTAAFDGFELLRAEIVETPPHDHDGSGEFTGQHWTAVLLHAREDGGGNR